MAFQSHLVFAARFVRAVAAGAALALVFMLPALAVDAVEALQDGRAFGLASYASNAPIGGEG
jgi:hypothetical protein